MNVNLNNQGDLKVTLNEFSLNFLRYYHQTSEQNSNLFYSSISLASALSVLLSGADGQTKQELSDLLGFNDLISGPIYSLENAFNKLKEDLKPNVWASNRPLFNMVNRMYLREDVRLLDDFKVISKEAYNVYLVAANFERDSHLLVEKINRLIAQETENKIQNAVSQIDPQTVMMLINVVYFKGKWKKRLSDVRPKMFTNLNGRRRLVDTMCEEMTCPFGQFEQYAIAQLDYLGHSSMYVVLPNKSVNLNELLIGLDARKLNQQLRALTPTLLDLELPKFTLKTDLNLKNILQSLGIKNLFSEQANLSKISNESQLFVSDAMQSAYVDVNEEGTEAAAATTMFVYSFGLEHDPDVPIPFHVDRPFIFLIRLNGVNIFVGAMKQF